MIENGTRSKYNVLPPVSFSATLNMVLNKFTEIGKINYVDICYPDAADKRKWLKDVMEKFPDIDLMPPDLKEEVIKTKKYLEKSVPRAAKLNITSDYIIKTMQEEGFHLYRDNNQYYIYNEQYWTDADVDIFKKFLGEAAAILGADMPYVAREEKFCSDLLRNINKDIYAMPAFTDKLVLNLRNCSLEIDPYTKSVKARKPSPHDNIHYQLSYDYDKNATCPKWTKFLDEVIPDKTLQNILGEYIAYVFIKNGSWKKLEKALLLYGTGANGKSVVFDVVTSIVGSQNITSYSLKELTDENGYARAQIENKLLNYASEISTEMNTTFFKQLVSGEPVSARNPYGKPFKAMNYAKFMFNCNELPRSVEHTHAFFRRFLIIEFTKEIPEHLMDHDLSKKIINDHQEMSGVLNWILEGMDRLLTNAGFSKSKSMDKTLDKYFIESSSFEMFIHEEGVVPSDTNRIDRKELFRMYDQYCRESNLRSFGKQRFNKYAEKKFRLAKYNGQYCYYCETGAVVADKVNHLQAAAPF